MHRSPIPVLYTCHITESTARLLSVESASEYYDHIKGCHVDIVQVDIVHMVVEFNSLYDARGLGVQTVWTKRLQQAKMSCRLIPFTRHDIIECYCLCVYEMCCIILPCSYVCNVLHNIITIINDNNVQCAMCYVHIIHITVASSNTFYIQCYDCHALLCKQIVPPPHPPPPQTIG